MGYSTSQHHFVIKLQNPVRYANFSPTNPQHLILESKEKAWYCDLDGHQIGQAYNGSNIAVSLDGTQLALYENGSVTIQDSKSQRVIAKFHIAKDGEKHCCFSPDGQFIAVSVADIAYVWNIGSSDPHPIGTFIGHTHTITALAFSSPSSLITASSSRVVQFWQIRFLISRPSPN
jgi:WD40 repeat protein